MDNQILQSDCTELPNQRLQAKINYLLQENDQKAQQIKQLYQELEKAKNMIDLLNLNSEISQKQMNQRLLDQLRIKEKQNDDIIKQRDIAQSKALLSEQVKIQSEMFFSDTLRDYEEKIQELRRIIHDKEYSVQQLEKLKPIQDSQGTYCKIKELITLNEQSLRFHDELENSYLAIKKQQKDLEKQIDITNKCTQENLSLKFELSKLKYAILNQMNYHKVRNALIYSKEIISDDEANILNLKKPSNFTRKLKARRSTVEQIKVQSYQEQENLIQQNEGKSINAHITSFISPQNEIKISKIEQDLERMKKLFERETLNNRLLSDQLNQCQQHNLSLQHTNIILIKSKKITENTIQLLRQKIIFLEKFWKKFLTNLLQVDDIKDGIHIYKNNDQAYNINDLKELVVDQQTLPTFTNNVQLIKEKNQDLKLRRTNSHNQLTLKVYDTVYKDHHKSNIPDCEQVGEYPNVTKNESRVYLLQLASNLCQQANFSKEKIQTLQFKPQVIVFKPYKPQRSLTVYQNYQTNRIIQIPCLGKLKKYKPIKNQHQNINIEDISVILPQNIDQSELIINRSKRKKLPEQVDQSFISQQEFLQLN